MLSVAEKELLESLPFTSHCADENEAQLVRFLYQNKLKKVSNELQKVTHHISHTYLLLRLSKFDIIFFSFMLMIMITPIQGHVI